MVTSHIDEEGLYHALDKAWTLELISFMDEAVYLRKKKNRSKNSVGEFNNERKSNRLYKKRYGIMRGNDTCDGIRFFVKPILNYVNYIDFRVWAFY